MRRIPLCKLALVLIGLMAGSAHAGRPLKDFAPSAQPTAEELAQSKERSKSNVDQYEEDPTTLAEPIPWAAFGLVVIVFAGVAPFAWRSYKKMAAEIAQNRPAPRAARPSDEF